MRGAANDLVWNEKDTGMSLFIRKAVLVAAAVLVILTLTGCSGDPVPDIKGQRYETAEFLLQRAGFRLGRVEYDDNADGPVGYIIGQYPRADSLATPGDDIDIIISGPQLTRVPMVMREDIDDARVLIREADMRRGAVTEQYSSYIPAGIVISQELTPGTRAPVGTKLELIVSLGPEDALVPGVIGEWERDARSFLIDIGFRSQVDREHSAEPAGVVIKQWPKARTDMVIGDSVDLTISEGPELTRVPNVFGMTAEEAEDVLKDAGMDPEVNVGRGIVVDDIDTAIVFSQQPIAGYSCTEGTPIIIYVREP